MKQLKEIFDDWLMRAAGIILVLIIAVVIFNNFSHVHETNPLLGVLAFSLVPVLFIAGAVVFVLAILRVEG